jgi:hypothetical protein
MPPPAEPPPARGGWGWLRGAPAAATLERERQAPAGPTGVGVSAQDLESRGHNVARSQAVVSTLLGIYTRRVRARALRTRERHGMRSQLGARR